MLAGKLATCEHSVEVKQSLDGEDVDENAKGFNVTSFIDVNVEN